MFASGFFFFHILSPIISFDIKHLLSGCSNSIVLGSKVRVTPVIFQVIYITWRYLVGWQDSLLIRLGPSIVFPFPALSSFIILRNHKKSISSSLYQMIESFSWLHVQTQCSACSPEWCLATMCIYQVLWCIWTMNHQKGDPTSKNSVRLWRSGSSVSEALVEGELSAES